MKQPSMKMDMKAGDRGYTIIEIMVVMVILIVVMALVVPVIGNARNAAKRTNTQQLLNNVAQASQQFELDNRRTPGYFSPVDMGHNENATRGFSEMANIMLDLAGGVAAVVGGAPPGAVEVGPHNAAKAYVRVALIGAPTQTKGVQNKGYLTPDPKYFVLHPTSDKKATNVIGHTRLPDLIDGFGQPLLAWRQDIDPSPNTDFAAVSSNTRASFYWNPNAAFLNATSLGAKGVDQRDISAGGSGSLLSFADDGIVTASMRGLLGNPAFPARTSSPSAPQLPAAARGKLVFHSAGIDGVYLGIRDRGGRIATAPGNPPHVLNVIDYKSGSDPLEHFDDVISVAGN